MKLKAMVRMASRSWLMMIIMAFMVVMFFPALVSGGTVVQILVNVVVLLAVLLFAFANGATVGETEITYGELLEKRKEKGYTPTEMDINKCYDRKRAFMGTLLGALPWVIISLVVLVSGMGYVHTAAVEETTEMLFPETAAVTAVAPHAMIDIAARVCFAAFMGFYSFIDNVGPGVLDYFFLPLSFVYPIAIYIGYLFGPKQHAKKLKMIEEGKQKKLRKLRADQKRKKRQQQQQPRKPKMEV